MCRVKLCKRWSEKAFLRRWCNLKAWVQSFHLEEIMTLDHFFKWYTTIIFISQKCKDTLREWVTAAQSCLTLALGNPTGYTIHGILQSRITLGVALPFSRGSSQPRGRTQVSHLAGGFFATWVTREAQEYWSGSLSLLQQIFRTPGSPALQADSLPTELSGKP